MDFMYESFSEVYDTNKVEVIMVDKDLQNLELLGKYFPHAKVLICTFHVIKYFKSILSDFDLNKNEKHEIVASIMRLIYLLDLSQE